MARKSKVDDGPSTQITEKDSSGRVTAIYLETRSQAITSNEIIKRIDIVRAANTPSKSKIARSVSFNRLDFTELQNYIVQYLRDAFLPSGYPHTVSPDYTNYQIFDSLQAFASSIAGLLSSRAVLQGVGVGDAEASPTAALLLSVLQDSFGRVATIVFAHRFGQALEPECKKWRLAADVFNDAAMILDCLSPAFPAGVIRVSVLACSATLRALCGVAAGSAKASLSNHFAIAQNLGEVSAKDSSQETVISLAGMLAGTVVVQWAVGPFKTWALLLLLLACHLACNYLAVRSVQMRCLNRQRASIVLRSLLEGEALSPAEVSSRERIFERDGVLRREDDSIMGWAYLGCDLKLIINRLGLVNQATGSVGTGGIGLGELLNVFREEDFILWYDYQGRCAYIALSETCSTVTQLKAWWLVTLVAKDNKKATDKGTLDLISDQLMHISEHFEAWCSRLIDAGWDLSIPALETRAGCRFVVDTTDR